MTDIPLFLFLQHNSDDRPPPNKFLSIQSIPTSSFRPGFTGQSSVAPSGLPPRSVGDTTAVGASTDTGFGNFGTGMGIGGQAWKVAGSKKA